MNGLQTWLRQWWRRWRLAEMRLLFLALLASVVAVSSVGFFTDRVERAMENQAIQLLGGDLLIRSQRPLADAYRALALERGVEVGEAISFRSMVLFGDALQLAQVKAVSANYPLQGALETADQLSAVGQATSRQALQSGELWAEPRLFNELGIQPGAEVQLGAKQFKLSKVLIKDPGQGTRFFDLAPNVLMPLADLEATGLLSPASRARFIMIFSGNSRAIQDLHQLIEARLQPTEEILSLEEGSPTVSRSLDRASRFLGLAALLSVVLAGAAIALTASSLVKHETRPVAVLKALGLSRKSILLDYLCNLWLLALLAGVLGVLIGFGLQFVLAQYLGSLIEMVLPAPSAMPALTGLLTALLMVSGFALPYLFGLVNTSPMQILQGVMNFNVPVFGWLIVGGLPAVFLLLWMQSGDTVLALWLLGGILLAVCVFWLVSSLVLKGLSRLSQYPQWQYLAVLRRSQRSSLLVLVFAMGLFSLLLLTSLRTDLISRWEASLPADAPNYFLINIQAQDVSGVKAYLEAEGVKANLYPIIRGRLVAINDKPVSSDDYAAGRAKSLLEREFNLSSFAEFPDSNTLLAGQWFNTQDKTGFSIEEGVGQLLGFGLGDKLTFDIAGQPYTEVIRSVRSVRWDSMQPNFFVIAGPGAFDDKPQTFMTSLYVDPVAKPLLIPSLVKQFSSITAIDTGAMLQQIRALMTQATFAVQGIFAFSLFTGLIVLLAALQSQKTERRRELAIMKSLGASHQLLKQRIWIEFILLGALAGLLAGLFALLSSNVLGYFLFELAFAWNIGLLLVGMVSGAALVSIAAYFNLRSLLNVTPIALLEG